jgi:hypothetical protein
MLLAWLGFGDKALRPNPTANILLTMSEHSFSTFDCSMKFYLAETYSGFDCVDLLESPESVV